MPDTPSPAASGDPAAHLAPGRPAAREGEAVLAEAVAAYRAALGSRLLAGYALGSLAHGGFSPLVSDVDLGLILRDPIRVPDRLRIRTVARAVRAGGSPLHRRLSVFWSTPSALRGEAPGGRFPALDRLDLLEHGRLLTGTDARCGLARPGPEELLAAGAEFALRYLGPAPALPRRRWDRTRWRTPGGGALEEIRNPSLLVSRGPRRLTKVVLFPVRFLFTAETGQVGTNALAVRHYRAGARAPAAELAGAALAWRLEPPAADAATALLERQLIPLYRQYIGDHITRLDALNRQRLADGFRYWRSLLPPGPVPPGS